MTDTSTNDVPVAGSPLLTAEQAATYLTISVSTLNKYRREGLVQPTYICADARYHRVDLDNFIATRRNFSERRAS
jgi:predicted site-specific integrase-resolvase